MTKNPKPDPQHSCLMGKGHHAPALFEVRTARLIALRVTSLTCSSSHS